MPVVQMEQIERVPLRQLHESVAEDGEAQVVIFVRFAGRAVEVVTVAKKGVVYENELRPFIRADKYLRPVSAAAEL